MSFGESSLVGKPGKKEKLKLVYNKSNEWSNFNTRRVFYAPNEWLTLDNIKKLGDGNSGFLLDFFVFNNPADSLTDVTEWGINLKFEYTLFSNFGEYYSESYTVRKKGNVSDFKIDKGGIQYPETCNQAKNGLWWKQKDFRFRVPSGEAGTADDVYLYTIEVNPTNTYSNGFCSTWWGFNVDLIPNLEKFYS